MYFKWSLFYKSPDIFLNDKEIIPLFSRAMALTIDFGILAAINEEKIFLIFHKHQEKCLSAKTLNKRKSKLRFVWRNLISCTVHWSGSVKMPLCWNVPQEPGKAAVRLLHRVRKVERTESKQSFRVTYGELICTVISEGLQQGTHFGYVF